MGQDNTYAEDKRLLLGVGDIYLNGVFVGNLKGKVEFKVKREYAYQRSGSNIADQKAECTGESASVTAEVCDLKLSQLRTALGLNSSIDIVTAKTIQKRQVVQVTALTSTVLGETPVIDATHPCKVMSLDRKTLYVSGTDYKISGGGIERISGSAITTGAFVAVEYSFSDSGAQSFAAGGDTTVPTTFRMDYVVRDSTGKAWQLTFFKAVIDTDFKIAFEDKESGNYTTYNIGMMALIDTTRPEGSAMYEIVQEDAAV